VLESLGDCLEPRTQPVASAGPRTISPTAPIRTTGPDASAGARAPRGKGGGADRMSKLPFFWTDLRSTDMAPLMRILGSFTCPHARSQPRPASAPFPPNVVGGACGRRSAGCGGSAEGGRGVGRGTCFMYWFASSCITCAAQTNGRRHVAVHAPCTTRAAQRPAPTAREHRHAGFGRQWWSGRVRRSGGHLCQRGEGAVENHPCDAHTEALRHIRCGSEIEAWRCVLREKPAMDGSRAATRTAVAAPMDRPQRPMRDTCDIVVSGSKFRLSVLETHQTTVP
jgi:hypothetical protein